MRLCCQLFHCIAADRDYIERAIIIASCCPHHAFLLALLRKSCSCCRCLHCGRRSCVGSCLYARYVSGARTHTRFPSRFHQMSRRRCCRCRRWVRLCRGHSQHRWRPTLRVICGASVLLGSWRASAAASDTTGGIDDALVAGAAAAVGAAAAHAPHRGLLGSLGTALHGRRGKLIVVGARLEHGLWIGEVFHLVYVRRIHVAWSRWTES